jgi:hypothetical protein
VISLDSTIVESLHCIDLDEGSPLDLTDPHGDRFALVGYLEYLLGLLVKWGVQPAGLCMKTDGNRTRVTALGNYMTWPGQSR